MDPLVPACAAWATAATIGWLCAARDARRESARRDHREDGLIERIQRPHLVPTSPERDEDPGVLVLNADDDEGYAKLRGVN